MTRKIVVGFILVLTLSASRPAEAARIDVLDRQTAAGALAAVFAGPLVEGFTGFFSVDVESEVWFDPAAAVYTYFYDLSNAVVTDPITSFDMAGLWLTGGSQLLNWGNITSEASGASLETGPGDVEFGVTMTASFSNAPGGLSGGISPGDFLTFYVQATTPSDVFPGAAFGQLFAAGEGYAPGQEGIPPIPEPGSLALIGSGLVGLFAAARRRRQLKG